jgi:hypothetical protein
VRAALASLPWVDSETIVADGTTLQVKFRITDPAQYDDKKIVEVLAKKGYAGASKMTGPTEK